ncbi:MAG: SDR family NAD(P)-dependent oxidoreductase [Ignavibacteriales bacterium]|nr:SDR family NAD(P)-dependent oxidoreductase [Ignavibacteriales bacterium]
MKKIIITGMTSGIGKALYDEFSKTYFLIGISNDVKNDLSKDTKVKIRCNLTDLDQVKKINFRRILKSEDKVIFINNAASIGNVKMVGSFKINELVKITNLNFISSIIIIQKIISSVKNKNITFFNMTTGAANHPIRGWSLYCSTKAASKMFFEVIREEFPEINVINFDPGIVDTGMQKKIRTSDKSHFPDVDKFKKYKNNNQLKSVSEITNEIKQILKL